jgi:malate dehydrogenase
MAGRFKVTVVGAGFVGATSAQRLIEEDLADVVLVDVAEGLARGKALDIMQSAAIEGFSSRVTGTSRYEETRDSDLIVITAGLARKPQTTRDDLLFKNAAIVASVVERAAACSPDAILLVVTNPLDVMTWWAWKKSGFPSQRVLGMAGVLDSARYSYFVAEELKGDAHDVRAVVLGGHGDQMVPVEQHCTVRGKPLPELLGAESIARIHQRTRDGGAEIVKLLGTGSAFYAPSAAIVRMIAAIVRDKGEVFPACVYVNGPYGIHDIYCGVPARIGRSGVREVVELPLSDPQRLALKASAEHVREQCLRLNTEGSK